MIRPDGLPAGPAQYEFRVTVKGVGLTFDQAVQVMAERLDHDEDYGFDYVVWFRREVEQ